MDRLPRHTGVLLLIKPLPGAILFLAALLLSLPAQAAGLSQKMGECAQIEDDSSRLRCFDGVTGRPSPSPNTSRTAITPEKSLPPQETVKEMANAPVVTAPEPSVMSRQWELDEKSRSKGALIRGYRPNYLLPMAYRSTLNQSPGLDVDSQARPQHLEAKFQISFKIKLWQDLFGKDVDLWFGYTQLAFWQLYNSAFSAPFRETNYEPEILLNFRTDYRFLGLKGRIINFGVNHQSNGRANPLSRSWNRIVANFGFERDKLGFLVKTWYRIPENASDDDNPDITKFMGNGELWAFYYWREHRFAAMVRNNMRVNNKGAIQLDWSFPLPFVNTDKLAGYIQYFNGYGESLIDYDNTVNRISLGFMLKDW